MNHIVTKLSIQEFLELPESDDRYELVEGKLKPKMSQKSTDYLLAGVDIVWVVDNRAQSVTVFRRDALPQTVTVDETISDPLLPRLELPVFRLFAKAPQGY